MADRYAVLVVQPEGYAHAAAFDEVAETLVHALRALGLDAVPSRAPEPGRRPIVLGSNLLPAHPLPLPAEAILYNLEQVDPGSPWLGPELVALFRRHEVWDYSARNAARYPALGLPPPRVVPIGWVPELARIAPAEEDVDVLFYGSMNERRRAALAAVADRGLRVHAAFGVYGAARDRLVARAKVVLNVHHYASKVLEVVRLSYLLGNGRCVVSERGADPAEARELEEAVAFADYGRLADACVRLCGDPAERRRLGAAGRRVMERRDAREILAGALGLPPPRRAPPAPGPAVPAAAPPAAAAPPGASTPSLTAAAPPAPASARPAPPAAEPPTPAYYDYARPEVVARVRPAGLRVLDVGCAAGAMGAAMLAAGASEVVGLELHAPAAARARRRLTAVFGYDLDALPELPYPEGYFDVVTLADVLEHLRDPAAVLRHLRRWLSDAGRIVCSIPNVRHESVLLPLLVEGRWDYAEAGILDRTHLRFFTVDSMVRLLAGAGFEPDGPVEAVRTSPSPAVERVAGIVGALGGDAGRFRSEASVVQVLVSARPARAEGRSAGALPDPWRGSRPVRVLLAPDLADPADAWARVLGEVVDGLGADEATTVAVALPLERIQEPPDAVVAAAERSRVDLLLTEAPGDAAGWERLLAGAGTWIATSRREELRALAARVGLEVQDAAPRAA